MQKLLMFFNYKMVSDRQSQEVDGLQGVSEVGALWNYLLT